VLVLLFQVAPVGASFALSFADWKLVGPPEWVGGANYQAVARDPLFTKTVKNTVDFAVGSVPLNLIVGFGLAYLLPWMFYIYMRPVSYDFIERRAMSKEYKQILEAVPLDAVLISGAQTIAVNYWAAIGSGRWQTIGTGGGWPGEKLFSIIQNHIDHRRRVFIDTDPRWWSPCGWQREEIPLIVELEQHFSFRHVKDTVYELSWLGDPDARDEPNLSRLLPENRPEEVQYCTGR
jgi:hypothetical protein